MPLSLDSTRALRGQKPKRKFTLVVTSHGRWDYLARTLKALDASVGFDTFDRAIFALDGGAYLGEELAVWFGSRYRGKRDIRVNGLMRQGLASNLANAWGALTADDEYVFHLEEDFIIHDAPLDEMADTLDAYRHVANMALVRQPWSAEEHRAGGLLFGSHIQGDVIDRHGWLEHKRIFTLNPFVASAALLRSLQPSVENDLTNQCLARGLSFGFWGGLHDPPRVEHIGALGGMGSEGWKA